MNAKQKRRSMRYWKFIVEVDEPWYNTDRAEWLVKSFGKKNKGRRYTWGSWNPTVYQFHKEQDYIAFVLKWGGSDYR